MSIREPAVAGMFYGADRLREEVEACFLDARGPGSLPSARWDGRRNIVGLVCPHAGYVYSGAVAAHAYARLAQDGLPNLAVIIGPSHSPYSPPAALSDDGAWRTPLGDVPLDVDTARKIASSCPDAVFDRRAHSREHSLEVQLPFLQYIIGTAGPGEMRIVPILVGAGALMASGAELGFARRLGTSISEALAGTDAVIIASTDFSHYISARQAEAKDSRAIGAIRALDEALLLHEVEDLDISMCGALPTAAAVVACKALGAASAELLAYSDSGDVTGDDSEVVGYAAMTIARP